MHRSKFGKTVAGLALMFAWVTSCSFFPAAQPTAPVIPSPHSDHGDNATAGAVQRSTREAQASLDGQATATRQALLAAETARAQENATATLVARATRQAVIAAKSTWPKLILETFKDNTLGWPLGLTKDDSLAVTSSIADQSYQWKVTVADGNSYWNLVPKNGPLLTDFYASVSVQFVSGQQDDQTTYGLAFRRIDNDYGFFGISKSGDFRILEVHHSGIYSLDQESSHAIDTRPGQVNRIAVAAVGPNFVFFINKKVVGQMTADIDPGQIGLGVDALSSAEEAQVLFSDFEVNAP